MPPPKLPITANKFMTTKQTDNLPNSEACSDLEDSKTNRNGNNLEQDDKTETETILYTMFQNNSVFLQ